MRHIPGIISIPDGLTKALGWILHSRHARRMMGHFIAPILVEPLWYDYDDDHPWNLPEAC